MLMLKQKRESLYADEEQGKGCGRAFVQLFRLIVNYFFNLQIGNKHSDRVILSGRRTRR
jgi:hypothetical protein